MRKVFYGILAVVAAITLNSCEKSYYEVEEIVQEIHPTVVNIDVPKTSWAYSYLDNNNYFYATVDMPELTQDVFNNGMIKMYRWVANNVQMEMPFTRHNEVEINGTWYFYTETVDYEFSVGQMTIYYTVSDFDYELDETFVPAEMKFRCTILK